MDQLRVVYGLRQVGSADIRYIGRTTKGVSHRLMRHFWQARAKGWTCQKPVSIWIRECGFRVEAVVIEETDGDLPAAELRWLASFREQGVDLINRLGYNWSPSQEQKEIIRETNLRRFADPAARQRVGESNRTRHVSDETRAKQSASHKGFRHTEESKAKMSASRKGVPKSSEARASMRAAQQRRAQLRCEGGEAR